MEKRNGLASIAPHALNLALQAIQAALLTRNIDAAQGAIEVAKIQLEALRTVAVEAEVELKAQKG